MLNWIIETSLRNRLVVVIASLLALVGGSIALSKLNVDAFPDTTPVQVQINTNVPSLGPEECETQITAPLEQALSGLPRIQSLRSISKFGLSQLTVTFVDGTDIYFARQLVNERLASVELPGNIERPKLGPIATGLGEVFHYLVSLRGIDINKLSEKERTEKLMYLRTVHDWTIKPKLRTVPGVAEVNAWGGFEKQFQVQLDPNRLLKHEVSFNDATEALAATNQNVGGGGISQGNQFVLVQGKGRINSLEQIENIAIKARDGVPIRIKDVADVAIGHEIRRGSVTANGRGEAVLGLCFMTMGENSRTVSSALRERIEEIRPLLPPEIELEIAYDRTELVEYVIETVRKNLFEGALLVIAVLFAFLGNLRAASIVALAIPLSMMFAFSGMWQVGIAASLLSLGALDFGMVVDSSVVMVENCVRHIAHGDAKNRSMIEIIRDAAVEVRAPTLFGELIIMIVYLPILTLEGIEGKLFRPMALTVIFALIGSMVLSLTLMPVLASLFLPKRIVEKDPLPLRIAHALHNPILKLCMDYKWAVFLFAISVLVAAFGMIAPHLGSEFMPKLSEGSIVINVVRLAGTDLDESMRGNTLMEKRLLEQFPDEVRTTWSRIGTAEIATDPMGIELTDMFVMLHPRSQWKRAGTQEELIRQMELLLRDIPGQRMSFSQPIELRMNEMISGVRADLGIKVFGDDLKVLGEQASKIEGILNQIDGSADVTVEQLTGQPILNITLKQDEVARYGILASDITSVIQAIGTSKIGEIVDGQLRFPLTVRLSESKRNNPSAIGSILINTPSNGRIPLSTLTSIDLVEGPSAITREWGQRRITITSNIRGRDMGSFVDEVKEKLKEVEQQLPSSRYHIAYGGQFENYESARLRLMIVVPVAILLIFVLLYFTYHNVVDALRVLTGVPFGWVGGIFALWLRGMPFSISAAIGFIALSGVAVLDDMILVSYVRQLRKRGLNLHEAVRQAAVTRLRPVLMTTLVASLGFLPMALSTGQGSEVQRPLATVVIGGVIGAMIMSLLVLRILYLVFDTLAHGVYVIATAWFGVERQLAAQMLGLLDLEQSQSDTTDEGPPTLATPPSHQNVD